MAVQLVLATYPAETRLHLKVLDPACGTLASTTGTDSDWIVKFIDVYPEKYAADPKMGGYQLMIASDVFRGRYHKSFEKPEPIPANAVLHYQIAFPANDHVFKQGHRIMVQVQSSWFPVIDRNPQRFVPNIFLAKEIGLPASDPASVPLGPVCVIHRGAGGGAEVICQMPIANCRFEWDQIACRD